MLYEIDDLIFSYLLAGEKIEAISRLSIKVPSRKLVTISGPSGSGKSTLLHILGLIEPVEKGKVRFIGEELGRMTEKRKNEIRRSRIGFIFQQFHLIPVLTAEENVQYFLTKLKLSKKEIEERSKESLDAVGLWAHRTKKPSQLSGGQKQRVAIARAIAKLPDVIIGDEPTASLDQKTGHEIMEILAKRNCSIVLATHDPMVLSFSEKNFHLVDGRLAE